MVSRSSLLSLMVSKKLLPSPPSPSLPRISKPHPLMNVGCKNWPLRFGSSSCCSLVATMASSLPTMPSFPVMSGRILRPISSFQALGSLSKQNMNRSTARFTFALTAASRSSPDLLNRFLAISGDSTPVLIPKRRQSSPTTGGTLKIANLARKNLATAGLSSIPLPVPSLSKTPSLIFMKPLFLVKKSSIPARALYMSAHAKFL
mmetsp:Transcript_7089/g.13875  ORF Transcript_7089/g.13875 Transcript_7089/m.13875 type:complete len:204 (+) Transcript_7089:637-1248(+)